MPDEPSGYELQRSLQALREDVRQVVIATGTRIDKKVSAEVHASDLKRLDQRIDSIEKDLAEIQAAQERDRATARQAKQWAIAVAVTAVGTLVAILGIIGDLL